MFLNYKFNSMGCTEQKFICYNSKKRKSKTKLNSISSNELDNNKMEIKNEIQKDNQINEENPNKINNEKEQNHIISPHKIINSQNIEEDSKDSDENDNNEPIPYRNLEMLRQLGPYLQTKNNPNFNFPEIDKNKYVGKGLRRMKGYKSIVSKEELEKMRKAFWETRIEGDIQVWNYLKYLCELPRSEEKNIKAMLQANEITPLLKCINVTYDKNGAVYEIPNYCINDPVEYDLPEMHIKKPKNKEIAFFARKGTKQIEIKLNNNDFVEKLKKIVGTKFKINENEVRLFFGGKELKNGNELWKYNVENECVIIIL